MLALPSLGCFGPKLLTQLSRCRAWVQLSGRKNGQRMLDSPFPCTLLKFVVRMFSYQIQQYSAGLLGNILRSRQDQGSLHNLSWCQHMAHTHTPPTAAQKGPNHLLQPGTKTSSAKFERKHLMHAYMYIQIYIYISLSLHIISIYICNMIVDREREST